jgi:polyhydroxybutyrate depolymerase
MRSRNQTRTNQETRLRATNNSATFRLGRAGTKTDCVTLKEQLHGLEAAKRRLQRALQKAGGEEKPPLVQQIRELEGEIKQQQQLLAEKGCNGTVMKWTVAREEREALIFGPMDGSVVKHPLVFAFHGHGGTMQGVAQQMHLQTVWPDAIVVYPQGLPAKGGHDQCANNPGWQHVAGDDGDRDLKLFDAMVASLRQKFKVDDERIYVTGFSNGAAFSYLLWAERGKVIAAIGVCSGHLWNPPELPTEPRALLAIVGRNDHEAPTQEVSIQTAQTIDNAPGPGQPCGQDCTVYPSTTRTPVKKFIYDGGHEYPSWAPSEIVKFFENHTRP